MDGTATTPPGTHATATRWSGSSQQICTSGGVRTGRHRQPAAQRQRTRHAYMIRHGVTCHRRQHAATTARSMACMHAAAAARQVAAAEQCSVPVPAFHRIARAIGARLGAVVVDCWWGLIDRGLHTCRYSPPWLLVAVQTTSSCITISESSEIIHHGTAV